MTILDVNQSLNNNNDFRSQGNAFGQLECSEMGREVANLLFVNDHLSVFFLSLFVDKHHKEQIRIIKR